jgi:hypothetical protein
MLLASYTATRPGLMGVGNVLIRARLRGPYSHSEIVWEPGDHVDGWMPDRSCAPDADGALWCASSVGLERLPPWSRRRAGHLGGVRLKRIQLDPHKWHLQRLPANPLQAVMRLMAIEGALYDWQEIASYLAWPIPQKASRLSCAAACAHIAGFGDPHRFDPCSLPAAAGGMQYAAERIRNIDHRFAHD